MDRKTQKAKSKAKTVAKKRAQGNPAFMKPTKEELELINKAVNDKKQNIVQAMKSYYQLVLTKKQADLFQARFEKAIEDEIPIKDNYGLEMSRKELEIEAQKNYIDLKFMTATLIKNKTDLLTTWGIDEKTLEKYWNKWFVDNEQIDYNA